MNSLDNNKHLLLMDEAIAEAKKALKEDEVPVGAIVLDASGEIVSRAYNRSESLGCQTGHAEVLAIEAACKVVGGWRLEGCSIYVTLEPCIMCFGLISLSRIKTIFYGAKSPLFGCDIDNEDSFPLYKKYLKVEGGLRDVESAKLLSQFFELRRKSKE